VQPEHMEAPAPAAPRHGGCWGLHVLCFHMYEGSIVRPRKARCKAEAPLSNVAYTIPPFLLGYTSEGKVERARTKATCDDRVHRGTRCIRRACVEVSTYISYGSPL
jgi:hypothetical protein